MTEKYVPEEQINLLHKGLEDKIVNTAYIINSKVDTSMKELIEHLNRIENQTIKTNDRVTKLEDDMVNVQKDLAFALKEVSGVNTIALRLKTERDQEREDRIKEQADTIKGFQDKDSKIKGKVIIGIIMAILAIASFIGLINADFLNQII